MNEVIYQGFGVTAGLIALVSNIPYLLDILANKTKPERATWFIWTVLNFIYLATNIAEGASYSIIFLVIGSFYALTYFVLSIKKGVGGFLMRDKISLLVMIVGLFFWWLTSNPITALLASLLVDAAGGWLTAYKTYYEPWSETKIMWLAHIFVELFSAISVGSLDFVLLAFPLYLLFYSLLMTIIISMRRIIIEQPKDFGIKQ